MPKNSLVFKGFANIKSHFQNNLGMMNRIHSLNFHSCLHMGHWCWVCWVPNHFMMQWMWKQ